MSKRTKEPRLFTEMDKQEEYERALFVAICMACGYPSTMMTRTARGRVQRAVKELAEIKATIEQVATVVAGMRREYKAEGVITPQGITGNWPKFVGGTAADRRLKKEHEGRKAEQLRLQKNVDRVSSLDAATLNGLRGQEGGWYLTAPANDPDFCERICNLLDAEARQ